MAPMVTQPRFLPLLLALWVLPLAAQGPEPGDPDYDPLEDDRLWGEAATVSPEDAQTTSPELTFLLQEPERTPHHHQNQIRLTASSLEDGWADLRQCHNDVAAIRRMVIVYNEQTIDDLQIESTRNIDSALVVDGDRVDLRGVERDAEVCVTARMKLVESEGNGVYRLDNGPFVRRFLDGYFPMRVTMAVSWGDLDLRLEDTEPAEQEGFRVATSDHGLMFDTLFEGELRTRIRLRNSQ
nr:hypothetical protein [Thioalkalivibrio sp. ALJ16]